MLEMSKTINLNGVVKVENEAVLYLNATMASNNGFGANISKSVVNQELYAANKSAVRLDVSKFEEEVYKLEDEAMIEIV